MGARFYHVDAAAEQVPRPHTKAVTPEINLKLGLGMVSRLLGYLVGDAKLSVLDTHHTPTPVAIQSGVWVLS
jgi:hypothetical protein